jgi:hypothetical protein
MKRTLAIAFAVLLLLSVGLAHAKGKEGEFSAPKDKVYQAALEVIASEWKLDSTDKESGVISFRTGMSKFSWKGQDVSIIVIETESGKSKIVANTEKRGSQTVTWGEGGKIQKRVLHLTGKKLFERGLIPEDEIPKK